MEQECDGGHPAFSPLARAVEDNAFTWAGEEFELFGLKFPTESTFGEFGEIGCGLGGRLCGGVSLGPESEARSHFAYVFAH